MLLKWDSTSWPKTLVILDNFVQWLVVNTLFQETIQLHNQKDGFKETRELGLYWKSRPVICTVNMELISESGLWGKTILILGSEFLMEQIKMWLTHITTTQKFLQIYVKNKRHNRVWRLLQSDQRRKQNHKREKLLNYRALIQWMKKKWIDIEPAELFVSAYEVSKKVINLNQFSQIFLFFGWSLESLLDSRRRVKKENISAALIFQEQFFTSALLKDTQDVISLILCYKIMW